MAEIGIMRGGGAGDGALIDIIRACAKHPAGAWQLPLEMIARIRKDAALTIPKDSRRTAIPLRRLGFSEIEKKIQAHEESVRCMAWSTCQDAGSSSEQSDGSIGAVDWQRIGNV